MKNKKQLKCITVNELNTLLKSDMIEYIEVADMSHQYRPKKKKVDVGGILNIYYR